MPHAYRWLLIFPAVVAAVQVWTGSAWALDRDAVIRKLEDLVEASRLPKFTQPVWDKVDRAAEKATVEMLSNLVPGPLRSPAKKVLGEVLSGRVHAKVRAVDLELIRSSTPVRWERHGPIRIPVPDIPLVDVDIPIVDKVDEVAGVPIVVPESIAR